MGCVHPFKAFKTGFKTAKGADDFILCSHFTTEELSYDRITKPVDLSVVPHVHRDGHVFLTDPIDVPCGSCVGCRMAKAKEWKIRNCLELLDSVGYFVTLTYDDEHLPVDADGRGILTYRDVQLFLKRWRKKYGPLRYFGCGEYGSGDATMRPHFHLIMYTQLPGLKPRGFNRFECSAVSEVWSKGHVLVELVTPGSIAYVSGYVTKKQSDPYWHEYPTKPFLFMSRRPGIGMLRFDEYRLRFGYDQHVYGRFSESEKHSSAPIPSSFRRKLKDEEYYTRIYDAAVMASESAYEVSKVVYQMAAPWKLNDIMEDAMLKKVEKLRKVKL